MNPRAIEVHIEELVLHGFPRSSRWDIADGMERELRTLLAEQGLPATWQASPDTISAETLPLGTQARLATTGAQIARAAFGGKTP